MNTEMDFGSLITLILGGIGIILLLIFANLFDASLLGWLIGFFIVGMVSLGTGAYFQEKEKRESSSN